MVIFAGKHPEEMGGKKSLKWVRPLLHAQVLSTDLPRSLAHSWSLGGLLALTLYFSWHNWLLCMIEPDSYGCSKMKNYNYLASITYNSQSLMEMFKSLGISDLEPCICFNSDDSSNSFLDNMKVHIMCFSFTVTFALWNDTVSWDHLERVRSKSFYIYESYCLSNV